MDDTDGSDVVRCDAPLCQSGPLPPAALHVSHFGKFCSEHCPRYGSMGCERCWPDFGDD